MLAADVHERRLRPGTALLQRTTQFTLLADCSRQWSAFPQRLNPNSRSAIEAAR